MEHIMMIRTKPNKVMWVVISPIFIQVMTMDNIKETTDGTRLGVISFASPWFRPLNFRELSSFTSAKFFVPIKFIRTIIVKMAIWAHNMDFISLFVSDKTLMTPNGWLAILFDISRCATITTKTLTKKIFSALSRVHSLIILYWRVASNSSRVAFLLTWREK